MLLVELFAEGALLRGRLFNKLTSRQIRACEQTEDSRTNFGNITYSTAGSLTAQQQVLYYKKVHSFLSPKLNVLCNLHVDVSMWFYKHSALIRYLEEALAETYTQLRVNGLNALPTGLRFPVANGYVTLSQVLTEAAVGTALVGGMTYGVYVHLNDAKPQLAQPEKSPGKNL